MALDLDVISRILDTTDIDQLFAALKNPGKISDANRWVGQYRRQFFQFDEYFGGNFLEFLLLRRPGFGKLKTEPRGVIEPGPGTVVANAVAEQFEFFLRRKLDAVGKREYVRLVNVGSFCVDCAVWRRDLSPMHVNVPDFEHGFNVNQ